jgi:hypothetical protein
MVLLFWICTILLGLGAIGSSWWSASHPWIGPAQWLLVVIDLVILGYKVLGWPG